MKRALFKSVNLIGDALYISPTLRQWHQEHPEYEIELLTLKDHITKLYYGMGVPLRAIWYDRPRVDSYDFQHVFNVNEAFTLSDRKQQHIAESYADLLGVKILPSSVVSVPPDMRYKPWVGPFYQPDTQLEMATSEQAILVSCFSASCSSRGNPPGPPNKMLPWNKWRAILKTIRRQFPDSPIWFLGAPTDNVPTDVKVAAGYSESSLTSGVALPSVMFGMPLDKLALVMRTCKFVITLDNGMAHLAASQKAKEFVFYPKALGQHYILPVGNPNMEFIHMDPNTLNPVEAVWHLKEAWKKWGLV